MNKKIFILMAVLFLLAAKGYCRKNIHRNYLMFFGDVDKKPIVMKIKSHCVSPKQPFHNPDTITSRQHESEEADDAFQLHTSHVQYQQMLVLAGRHGSKHTVSCLFNKGFKKQNFTFNKRPHKLNFAVTGTLTIDGVSFDDMVLAQGNQFFRNNWWFGGKNCQHLLNLSNDEPDIDGVNCTARDKKTTWCFFRGTVNKKFDHKHIDSTNANFVRIMKKKCVL